MNGSRAARGRLVAILIAATAVVIAGVVALVLIVVPGDDDESSSGTDNAGSGLFGPRGDADPDGADDGLDDADTDTGEADAAAEAYLTELDAELQRLGKIKRPSPADLSGLPELEPVESESETYARAATLQADLDAFTEQASELIERQNKPLSKADARALKGVMKADPFETEQPLQRQFNTDINRQSNGGQDSRRKRQQAYVKYFSGLAKLFQKQQTTLAEVQFESPVQTRLLETLQQRNDEALATFEECRQATDEGGAGLKATDIGPSCMTESLIAYRDAYVSFGPPEYVLPSARATGLSFDSLVRETLLALRSRLQDDEIPDPTDLLYLHVTRDFLRAATKLEPSENQFFEGYDSEYALGLLLQVRGRVLAEEVGAIRFMLRTGQESVSEHRDSSMILESYYTLLRNNVFDYADISGNAEAAREIRKLPVTAFVQQQHRAVVRAYSDYLVTMKKNAKIRKRLEKELDAAPNLEALDRLAEKHRPIVAAMQQRSENGQERLYDLVEAVGRRMDSERALQGALADDVQRIIDNK